MISVQLGVGRRVLKTVGSLGTSVHFRGVRRSSELP